MKLIKTEEQLEREKRIAEFLAQQPLYTEEEMLQMLEIVTE